MNLSALLNHLLRLPAVQDLLDMILEGEQPEGSLRAPRSARPALAAALTHSLHRPVFYVVSRADRVLTLLDEFPPWIPGVQLVHHPEPDPLFYEIAPWSARTRQERIRALSKVSAIQDESCMDPGDKIFLMTARSLMTRTISPDVFSRWRLELRKSTQIALDELAHTLVECGYEHSNLVTEPGDFSRRGGILDIWPPSELVPTRIEFFGDEIDSIRAFNPNSQRTLHALDCCTLAPAREGLPASLQEHPEYRTYIQRSEVSTPDDELNEFFLPLIEPNPNGVLDYADPNAIVIFEDRTGFEQIVAEIEEQALQLREEQVRTGTLSAEFPIPYLTNADLNDSISSLLSLDLGFGQDSFDMSPIDFSNYFIPGPRFGGQLDPIIEDLLEHQIAHETTVIVSRQAPRLQEIWSGTDPDSQLREELPDPLLPGHVHILHGRLSEGWTLEKHPSGPIHLLTDAELFGWSRPRPRRRPSPRAVAPEMQFADLKQGDLVVHVDFGIGRFTSLVERTIDGVKREYLLVEFADGDQLYVPVHQADRISRYIGADGRVPIFSRLGTREWERVKTRASKAVEEVARDLLDLYARRQATSGIAFSEDTPWQAELEASFPYQETRDQSDALDQVKSDMERPIPMDRLICGDVGYGKTEVALRAAFKAMMDGKQVAMLVPTTVLAQQHYYTFLRRLSAFPVEIEMLSRFRTAPEARNILERLRMGEVDLVIGTHRLLQPDVEFKDLGLLIIDEEQRFGVTHKEILKKMRTEVDVLTLTATPIPRTLYMALTGARDISTINTPPEERLPVVTHVGPYNPRLVRGAIMREIDRGGQVFFVHNRVQTINNIHHQLQILVPEARTSIAHGQMPENELSKVMEEFAQGEIDVLVSTSIIESGLDIPNANTLIVDRSDRFGLAQLYQLRGRVGRGAIQGYAYFFYLSERRTTLEALQRLETIAEHSQLGAGYAIAMRDLEMRGAGDILGTRQHGHISAVGFHLYTRLLSNAVQRLRASLGDQVPEPAGLPTDTEFPPASIELPLAAVLPEDYVQSRDLRLQLYRRMAELRSLEDLEILREEISDRFGDPPLEVDNLFFQLQIKVLATRAGVAGISIENGQILIDVPEWMREAVMWLERDDLRLSKRGLWLAGLSDGSWRERLVDLLEKLIQEQIVA